MVAMARRQMDQSNNLREEMTRARLSNLFNVYPRAFISDRRGTHALIKLTYKYLDGIWPLIYPLSCTSGNHPFEYSNSSGESMVELAEPGGRP
jgi:hypothetical protein